MQVTPPGCRMTPLPIQKDADMQHLTTLDELKQHITLLAGVEESGAPFISCYLNLGDGAACWRKALDDRASILRRVLKGDDLVDLEEALGKIEVWLATDLLPEAKGVAIFVRGIFGGAFMLPMQFAAPLPNWITVYPTPNIYHLVELKDNYHRYVVILAIRDKKAFKDMNSLRPRMNQLRSYNLARQVSMSLAAASHSALVVVSPAR